MRQPWLKSDTFASKFFWNIGELLELRCSPAPAANRPDRVASRTIRRRFATWSGL